jgi:hypothetical protein
MNYNSLSKKLPKDLVNIIGSYLGIEPWYVRSNYKNLHGIVNVLGLLKEKYLDFASYNVKYDETDPDYKKDIKKIYKVFDKFCELLRTDEVINIVYATNHSSSTQFKYQKNINIDTDLYLTVHESFIFFKYINLRSDGIWIEEIIVSQYLAWFYHNPPICLCCKKSVDILDGPMNSDISTECPHYLNVQCWEKLFRDGEFECPLCYIDISEWIDSHF